jgi:hypothetical protein
MLFRLSMAAALIAATVVIQALFMSAGLNTFKRIEENRPGAMTHKPATTIVLWVLFLLIPIILDVTHPGDCNDRGGLLPAAEFTSCAVAFLPSGGFESTIGGQ